MSSIRMIYVLSILVQSACSAPLPAVAGASSGCPVGRAGVGPDAKFDDGRPALPDGIACLSWPMGSYKTISSAFRDFEHPFVPGKHSGTDIPAPDGVPVLALSSGVVTWTRPVTRCGDATVGVRFGEDWGYEFHHLSRVDVEKGQAVVRGQRLGLSGGKVGAPGSGQWTTGAHLHLSMIHEKSYVNAIKYLCP